MTKTAILLLICCLLTSCSTQQSIGHAVTQCCPSNYSQYTSYTLVTNSIPGFLTDTIVRSFDLAMQEKGLTKITPGASKVSTTPSLVISLRYVHIDLEPSNSSNANANTPWDRHESYNQPLNYMAKVVVEMREYGEQTLIWAGHIQRRHRVQPGEHMHEDRASGDILMAFREVLANYPPLNKSHH